MKLQSAAGPSPKGLRPPAQGRRFGYPGKRGRIDFQPQRGCVILESTGKWRNRVAVELFKQFGSQGSRNCNPGLEGTTALRLKTKAGQSTVGVRLMPRRLSSQANPLLLNC